MITAIVQFTLPKPVSPAVATFWPGKTAVLPVSHRRFCM